MEENASRREFLKASVTAGAVLAAGSVLSGAPRVVHAKELQAIQLSKPQGESDNVILKLLEKRASSREFSPEPLPVPVLSNLLWAAFGINRPDGKRTAPSARNRQEIDIYVTSHDGLYLYDPKGNRLNQLVAEDIRGLAGSQPFVKQAAVNLVYVADLSKMGEMPPEERALWMGAATGAIVENVYLFCAAEGLATVVRAMIDRPALAKAMSLRRDQAITLSQTVGYPKKG
jgi:nitroreductase